MSDDPGPFESQLFETPEAAARFFDARVLGEPLSVLSARPPILCSPATTVAEAMHAMQKEHTGCVLVTERGGADSPLCGIFTERDVLYRIIDGGRNPATLPLGDVMTRSPESLPDGATVAYVLNRMALGGFRHVPVVDREGRPVSVVSVRDVVHFLVDHFSREVMTLPPDPGAEVTRRREGA